MTFSAALVQIGSARSNFQSISRFSPTLLPKRDSLMSTDRPTGNPVHLAVDLGASSGRVMAGSMVDGKLELETIHRFANDPVHICGTMQWKPLQLWSEIEEGLRIAARQFDKIVSVGVDTWGVDYVLLTDQEQVAGPVKHYRDTRTLGLVEKAFDTVDRETIFQETGLQFMEINSLYQLIAARRTDDPSLKIATDFLMMGDYFHWLLSGKRGVELTNASTTQLLDPRTKQWSDKLIEAFDLPRHVFGDLVNPGSNQGNITDEVAARTGLANDVSVVVPATHDTASAVLAVPASEFAPTSPDWCYISSGTWSLMGCELAEPLVTPECSRLNFTNEGGVRGSTRLLKNIGGLWIFQQIRAAMMRRGVERSWDEMVQMASDAESLQCLIDPDDPAFVAPADMVTAIEQRAIETGQAKPTDEGAVYRAALEGLALRYRSCLGSLESLVGNQINTIHIVGGGSVNKLLCQFTADACNRRVVAGPVEATAIGNVLMQMIGTGSLDSIDEARRLVRSSFETIQFDPRPGDHWDEAAEKFEQLC